MTPTAEPCPAQEILFALADGALPEPEAMRIQAHLTRCDRCRRLFSSSGELHDIAWVLGNSKMNDRDYDRIERCKNRVREELKSEGPP